MAEDTNPTDQGRVTPSNSVATPDEAGDAARRDETLRRMLVTPRNPKKKGAPLVPTHPIVVSVSDNQVVKAIASLEPSTLERIAQVCRDLGCEDLTGLPDGLLSFDLAPTLGAGEQIASLRVFWTL